MLTGAVGATSVLMTVGSRPSLGAGCMSFATVSVNAASSNTEQAQCARHHDTVDLVINLGKIGRFERHLYPKLRQRIV